MLKIASLFLFALTLFGADISWKKVQDLKSGSELHIYKKGVREPVVATFDQATDERLIVLTKNEQTSIAKEDIDRIDSRPPQKKGSSKFSTTSTTKTTDPDYTPHPSPGGINVPGTEYSSSVSKGSGSKADFETVYRK